MKSIDAHPVRYLFEVLNPKYGSRSAAQEPVPRPSFYSDPYAWEELFEYSEKWLVTDFVLKVLARAKWSSTLPDSVRTQIRLRNKRNMMLEMMVDEDYQAVVEALLNERVPLMTLKGSDLNRRYYSKDAPRSRIDAKFIVPRESFSFAMRVFGKLGFRQYSSREAHGKPILLSKRQGGPEIEVRSQFFQRDSDHQFEKIWKRATDTIVPGFPRTTKLISDEDYLIFLIVDAIRECSLSSPLLLVDVDQVLKKNPHLDWERIRFQLKDRNALGIGLWVLTYLRKYWSLDIPADTLEFLGGEFSPAQKKQIESAEELELLFLEQEIGLREKIKVQHLFFKNRGDFIKNELSRIFVPQSGAKAA